MADGKPVASLPAIESTCSAVSDGEGELLRAAEFAAAEEHSLSNYQAFKKYWKGMAWALFLSLTVISFAFDVTVSNNLVANPVFQEQFGFEYDPVNLPGVFIISTAWQTGMLCGLVISQMVGAFAAGPLADRFGRKKPIYVCLIGNVAFVFLEVFGTSIGMIFAGTFLNGISYGFYYVLAPLYAAEVVPYHVRHIAIAFTNMANIIGALLGTGIATATLSRTDAWSYRLPFAFQWIWVFLILAGLPFCPESPWYFVAKGDFVKAEKSLTRLAVADNPDDLPNVLAQMRKIDLIEKANSESTSYLECFKGTDLRRTEIASVPFTIQIVSATTFLACLAFFLEQTGLSARTAFNITTGSNALGFLTTLACYPMMLYIGRRTVWNWGCFVIFIIFFIVGFLDLAPDYETNDAYSWAQSILLVIATGWLNLTISPVSWIIMSETSSSRLRSKTIAVGVFIQDLVCLPIVIGLPYELNASAGNWRGKAGFFYGGICLAGAVWGYFRLPELKGRTFEEIDVLFQQRVPTRKFASYKIVGASPANIERHSGEQRADDVAAHP